MVAKCDVRALNIAYQTGGTFYWNKQPIFRKYAHVFPGNCDTRDTSLSNDPGQQKSAHYDMNKSWRQMMDGSFGPMRPGYMM